MCVCMCVCVLKVQKQKKKTKAKQKQSKKRNKKQNQKTEKHVNADACDDYLGVCIRGEAHRSIHVSSTALARVQILMMCSHVFLCSTDNYYENTNTNTSTLSFLLSSSS